MKTYHVNLLLAVLFGVNNHYNGPFEFALLGASVLWIVFLLLTNKDYHKRLTPRDLKTRWQWLKIAWWRFSLPEDDEYVVQFKDGTYLNWNELEGARFTTLAEALQKGNVLSKSSVLFGLARLLDARPVTVTPATHLDALDRDDEAIFWNAVPNLDRLFGPAPHELELKRLYAATPEGHYAVRYPDGTYAWESNCQGWGSTPKKPKIGDPWCFDKQHAIWALRDLRGCQLVSVTE